jgi:integrase
LVERFDQEIERFQLGECFAVAKTVRDARLDSRAAREKLKPSGKPYFRDLEPNLHLGYRKGKHGGKWVMRRYVGDERYVVETIGGADDFADADGVETLTFHQAQTKARERAAAAAEEARIASMGPAITVRTAINEYLALREKREARDHAKIGLKRDPRSRLTKHVLEANERLAAKALAALTTDDLAKWRRGLQMAASSVQRTCNDFKSALNAAVKRYKTQLPATIRDTIKDGLASVHAAPATAREAQVLPDADVRALISATWEVDGAGGWEGDLGRIVLVLAATGARFSQVNRMTVADVQAKQKRLMVPVSRKGRGVKNSSHIGVRVGDDVLAALAKATAGRKGSEPLFLRPRWEPVGEARWEKGERAPWHSASQLTRPRLWAAIVARAGLAAGTIPYALRHSSIVRGLRAGLPVRLVAALHDTSSAMIERHYAAFIVDAMDELAARAVVPLTTAPAVVIPIDLARGSSR